MLCMKNKLIEAIETSSVVRITYKGLIYDCEFYCLWQNKQGKMYVHGYKRCGGYLKNPDDHFANFIVRYITKVEPIGRFTAPLQRYNPRSKMFYKVCHEWRYRPSVKT